MARFAASAAEPGGGGALIGPAPQLSRRLGHIANEATHMNGTKRILLVAVLATSALGASAAPVAARSCTGYVNSNKAHLPGSNGRKALGPKFGKNVVSRASHETNIFSPACQALADALNG
jgi:hypothetical protein